MLEGPMIGICVDLGSFKARFHELPPILFVLLQHTFILSQTFQYFFLSIVRTLGYDPVPTLLLTVPV